MVSFLRVSRKKPPQEITFHPKLDLPIKYAFTEGAHYYQFVNDYEMPKKRFSFAQKFYSEMRSKVTSETLVEFCDAIISHLDKGELVKAAKLTDELKYRSEWLFEPESLLRFASVVYFTLEENVTDYDFKYNENKIELFKKKGLLINFLQMLSEGQKIISSSSPEDLKDYLIRLNAKTEKQLKLISEAKASNSK